MIVGAGEAASFILTQNRRAGSQYGQVLALVDDAPEKQNMRVQNVPVMGRIKDVPALVTHEQLRPHLCAGYGRAGPHHETGGKTDPLLRL
jgi:FlaA1/EpsC-like NDP-sugar epimerase